LLKGPASWPGTLFVLAGHFYLVFRERERRFVPLLRSIVDSDGGATQLEYSYVAEVGDFPEESWALAAELASKRPIASTKLVLLVDDHQFRRIQPDAVGSAILKTAKARFFSSAQQLPPAFSRALSERGLPQDVVEKWVDPSSGEASYFLSESLLRRHFSRQTKSWLLRRPGFSVEGREIGIPRFLYREPGHALEACLVDEVGEATCSATSMQLLVELAKRGARNALLFVPYYCRGQVEPTMAGIMSVLEDLSNVWVVWGQTPGLDADAGREVSCFLPLKA
jgi:hypothetical protein